MKVKPEVFAIVAQNRADRTICHWPRAIGWQCWFVLCLQLLLSSSQENIPKVCLVIVVSAVTAKTTSSQTEQVGTRSAQYVHA